MSGMDLNDGFGRRAGQRVESIAFGEGVDEEMGSAAEERQGLLELHNMYAYNTASWGGYMYFGPRDTKRVIDYIAGPRSLLPQLHSC